VPSVAKKYPCHPKILKYLFCVKKAVCILFVLVCLGKNVQSQTLHTIDSLAKVEQACLDEGRYMIGCVATYKRQMDSLLELSLKKLYAKGGEKVNLALKTDQENWLVKQKAYNEKVTRENHEQALKDDYADSEIERLNLLSYLADFVEKRVRYLVKKLNNP
jgi:hypothetical protein